ncbi:MAG: putative molybdenum carrier protein [Gammaproteobacteria bacterium]|jgi:predicted Rossmann fold nucleotide-binding protein DprA/Smf involved in DNA uptake
MYRPGKIISGGQTGVDRAALDVAIELGIDHGGWCPAGRKAEDGQIPSHYRLTETRETDYVTRTRLNVRDSDGTLILSLGETSGGTLKTFEIATELGRPLLLVDLNKPLANSEFHDWLSTNQIKVLNIAGPRESKYSGIQLRARDCLRDLLD